IAKQKQYATEKLEQVINYARAQRCRRQSILDYFGDESDVVGCACDMCRAGQSPGIAIPESSVALPDEVVTLIRQLLSAIARLNGRFGVGAVAEVLTGSESDCSRRWGWEQPTVFGLLRIYPTKKVISLLHRFLVLRHA